jgi:hypothetical protein
MNIMGYVEDFEEDSSGKIMYRAGERRREEK